MQAKPHYSVAQVFYPPVTTSGDSLLGKMNLPGIWHDFLTNPHFLDLRRRGSLYIQWLPRVKYYINFAIQWTKFFRNFGTLCLFGAPLSRPTNRMQFEVRLSKLTADW
jgi:hypothetical protein